MGPIQSLPNIDMMHKDKFKKAISATTHVPQKNIDFEVCIVFTSKYRLAYFGAGMLIGENEEGELKPFMSTDIVAGLN